MMIKIKSVAESAASLKECYAFLKEDSLHKKFVEMLYVSTLSVILLLKGTHFELKNELAVEVVDKK